jgi:hypothetical protein
LVDGQAAFSFNAVDLLALGVDDCFAACFSSELLADLSFVGFEL